MTKKTDPPAESTVVKVRIFPSKNAHLVEWYYEPKGANEQVLSVSEGYSRREDAIRAATAAYPGVELKIDR